MKIIFKPTYAESEKIRLNFFKDDILKRNHNRIANLLDIGCSQLDFINGEGRIKSYGIDKNTSQYYQQDRFIQCDLDTSKIPFNNSIFDFVVAGEVIEHVKRPFELLDEISRVLKPGAYLYLSTPNPYFYLESLKELFGINTLDDKEHLNLFSKSHLINYSKKLDLRLIKFARYKFWVPFLKLMVLSTHTPPYFNYQNIYIFQSEKK